MTASSPSAASKNAAVPASGSTLRALLDARRADGGRTFSLDEAIAVVVPLCLDLKERHARGEKVHVHPSCVAPGADGLARLVPELATAPSHPRDRACVAPEHQGKLDPGDARSSVFSVGAMLYEMLTGSAIGPAMRRPKEIDPSLPDALEAILGKALVGDPAHRPDDLGALASALHHVAPMKSIPPPDADESRLDHTESFDVDVRLSMLPPTEIVPSIPVSMSLGPPPDAKLDIIVPKAPAAPSDVDPFAPVAAPVSAPRSVNDPTAQLAALKARLEADPRPRYVVTKDRMDHGPFTAVELLQQISSNAFVLDDGLRDEISGQSRPIKEWEEFAPFASQADLRRQIVAEKKEVERVAEAEKKAGLAKSTLGIAIVVALVAAGGVFVAVRVGARKDEVSIADDPSATVVDPAGSVRGKKVVKQGGGVGVGGFTGGMSYEEAISKNVQEVNLGGGGGAPDLTDAQLVGPINARVPEILASCGVPSSTKLTIKVAIKQGRAVGVTVITNPPNPSAAGCVDRGVRGITWPAHPKMDSMISSW
jgi:hypothetical protein